MRKSLFSRVWSLLLAVVMVVGMIPATMVSAVDLPDDMSVVSDNESTLAPGVTQNQVVLYNDKGERVEMFVTTADMSVDTVKLFASYKDMDPTNYGMSKLTEQVDAFNKKAAAGDEYYQGTVVAGINASYYNMINGKPTGTFVMNGIDVTTESEGNAYGYFAVMKDGSVKIGNKGDYSKDKGNIQEAIGIYTMLIVDGKICSGLDTTKYYPRQTIGITADGDVILMTADGNQAPKSIGLTVQEQAEVMLELGCVWAGHLDGGGSCTYACKPEGSDDFAIANSPSDGSERSVSNGFLIVSTAAASYTFDHVVYDVENDYLTPGSSVKVSMSGVSSTGNAAEIPAGITYVAENGTIVDGVFTAGDQMGTATITAMYEGKAVGQTTLNVVAPDAISFSNAAMTVPFGKTVSLKLEATYGARAVTIDPANIQFQFSDDSIGTIDGFSFTAGAEGVAATSATLTATLVLDPAVTATATVKLGKGSEVVYDFENGTDQNIIFDETPGTKYNYVWPETQQQVVTSANGKVHSGKYALAMHVDYSNSLESGYMKTSIYATETKIFKNAVGVGCWIYIPDECVGLWARWTLRSVTGYNADGTPIFNKSTINSNTMDTTAGGTGVVYSFCEPGWHYLYADTSAYEEVGWAENSAMMQFYISDRDGSAYNYVASENSNIPSSFQFYLDDVTVDYSSAVDDREAPVISNVTYAVEGMPDAAALNGQTITTNKVTFGASVAEYTGKDNYTGVDPATVKAYIDGVQVAATYTNGLVSVADVILTNGKHIIKFSACDYMGNYSSVMKTIVVDAAESGSTVKLVPADPSADRILLSSIYNMDLVASAIEEVDAITVVLDLDNNSTWQLDHMIVADGFSADHTVDETDNIATITITRTGTNAATGEAVLATLPVRVWTLKTGYVYENGTKAGQQAMTLSQFKAGKEFWRMSVIANVDMGVLTRVDGTSATFTGERVFCDTEMWGNFAAMDATAEGKAYFNAWNGGHVHSAAPVADKAATCTAAGYTGRTYCAVCDSVVEWGTAVPATGHTYAVTDGVLQCSCGETFSGVHTDGKTYVDGIPAQGWAEDSYYVDGLKLTGIQLVEGYYYDFGAEGVCAGKIKYTGLYINDTDTYYVVLGELKNGWQTDGTNWYYFDLQTNAALKDGRYTIDTYKYTFDSNGVLTLGEFVRMFKDGKLITKYMFAGKFVAWQFFEIQGKTYYFYRDASMATGISMIQVSRGGSYSVYDFDDDGVYNGVVDFTGVYEYEGKLYSLINGEVVARGAFQWDGGVYFSDWKGVVQTGKFYVDQTNDVITKAGYYFFDETGKMYHETFAEIDGTMYYMVNGQPEKTGTSQVVQIDGALYFINWDGKVSTGKVWVDETNAYAPVKGYYYFDETGRMYDNEFTTIDGALYYMVDGRPYNSGISQVIEIDGACYFVNWNGKVSTGKIWADTTNEFTPVKGYYYFDETGRMYDNEFAVVDGAIYYMVGGVPYKSGVSEVMQIDGACYFVNWNGRVSTGKVWADSVNEYTPVRGYYYFDETGRMYDDEFAVVDGAIYYMVGGVPYKSGVSEVMLIDGACYFVNWNGKVSTGKVWADSVNEYTPVRGYYYFDETGRMYDDEFAVIDGAIYYMVGGVPYKSGVSEVMEIDGACYFVNWNGKVSTGKIWADSVNEYTPVRGYYYFDETGRMYDDEFAVIDGAIYYMVGGQPYTTGVSEIVEINGELYFVNGNGKVSTGKVWVDTVNAYAPQKGYYYFDETGKLMDEVFLVEDGALYYIVDGRPFAGGVFEVDGDLYYAAWDGKLAVSGEYFITDAETNDLIRYGYHDFDDTGKMIG